MVELCQIVLDGRGMADERCGTTFQGERGCNELWGIQGSEVTRTCYDCSKHIVPVCPLF